MERKKHNINFKKITLVLLVLIVVILTSFTSFAWFSDKKGAEVTIKFVAGSSAPVGSVVLTQNITTADLTAENVFEKNVTVNIQTTSTIYFRTYAIVRTEISASEEKTDLVELIKVTKTKKATDGKFYYVNTGSVIASASNTSLSLTYRFHVKDLVNNYNLSNTQSTVTFYVDYCEQGGQDAWSSNLISQNYTLTYNANGGSCSAVSKSVTYGETIGTLETPTKSGYTFVGWFTESGKRVTSSSYYVTNANSTIYAKWK